MVVDGVVGVSDLVEAMHGTIAGFAPPFAKPRVRKPGPIAALTYGSLRLITRGVGQALDLGLRKLTPLLKEHRQTPHTAAIQAALNGVLGDYLARTANPLAQTMRVCQHGQPLKLEREALAAALGEPRSTVVVLVHGLCMNDRQWLRDGHDHGAMLAAELGCTALYLRYNTGMPIASNGRALADLLETLIAEWPLANARLLIVGHSMGGLVARSACDVASRVGHRWPSRLERMVFLGTPHLGAPLERAGRWLVRQLAISPYTAPFARLGGVRSAGIQDLHDGRVSEDADHTRGRVPFPAGVRCHAIAASTGTKAGRRLVGDGLVPVASALGLHSDRTCALGFPDDRQAIVYGTDHLALLSSAEVGALLRLWLAAA